MLPSSAALWVNVCRVDTAKLCSERCTAKGLGATDMTYKEGNPEADRNPSPQNMRAAKHWDKCPKRDILGDIHNAA